MPFMSMDDAEFWELCPENMKHAIQGGVTRLAYFLLGEKKDNPATVVALRMGPGCVLPRHGHDCHRFEIVVHGTLDVGERVPISSVRGIASKASRYSGKVSHCQSIPANKDWRGMSSTLSIIDMSSSRRSGTTGANPTPQLPITTVDTPCHRDCVSSGSHDTCPS